MPRKNPITMPTASRPPTIFDGTAPSLKRCTYGDHLAPRDQFRTRARNGKPWVDSWCKACRRESNADNHAAGVYVKHRPAGPGIPASRVRWIGVAPKGRPAKRRLRILGANDNALTASATLVQPGLPR